MDRTRNGGRDRAADAPARLIEAAIELFGRKGFEGATTREIAKAAGVNIAGIAYHFGGKQALYEACAGHIAGFVRARLGARLEITGGSRSPADAEAALRDTLSAMIRLLLGTPEMDAYARFVLREQMEPTAAFAILFEQVVEPLHKRICALWALATGEPRDAEDTVLRMLGLVGQIFMFRLARAGALGRLGWQDVGPRETAEIERMVHGALDALLAQHRHVP